MDLTVQEESNISSLEVESNTKGYKYGYKCRFDRQKERVTEIEKEVDEVIGRLRKKYGDADGDRRNP